MPQNNSSNPFQNGEAIPSSRKRDKMTRHRSDVANLILDAVSDQIDRARLEILAKVQEIHDSVEIMARRMRNQMDERGGRGKTSSE